jgi:uncharacterized protein (TIGR00725 family)
LPQKLIGIIGQAQSDPEINALAYEVGRLLAVSGFSIVNGGLTGVMEFSAKGFQEGLKQLPPEKRGTAIGILPGKDTTNANRYLDIKIATGMGQARNAIIVSSAEILIAIGKGYGTLSEIALALREKKTIAFLKSWDNSPSPDLVFDSPDKAVDFVKKQM